MPGQISWVFTAQVKDGRLDDVRALMDEMVSATHDEEPGTLGYQWFVNGDGTTVHIYERFEDDAAALAHFAAFGERWLARFVDAARPTGVTVYGSPGEQLRKATGAVGAAYMGELGGFVR